MGSDAELYVFDVGRYRDEVVPALVELLTTGQPNALVRDVVTRMDAWLPGYGEYLGQGVRRLAEQPFDFSAACTYLGRDLRLLDLSVADGDAGVGWGHRACRSPCCPARAACPMHNSRSGPDGLPEEIVEQWLGLFQQVVGDACLGRSQFLGRNFQTALYRDTLARMGVGPADPLASLLTALGARGFVLGYGFGHGEGIHGWLDEAETVELAERLGALPLPSYPASFAGMGVFRKVRREPFRATVWEHPSAPFEELSLSFVRTVATIAAAQGTGVLWGNDAYRRADEAVG